MTDVEGDHGFDWRVELRTDGNLYATVIGENGDPISGRRKFLYLLSASIEGPR